ncbi:AER255Cp [Eremothecium gossypii ATCC 10895]|uniref:Pre-mRNA-processing factor 17 n=1 Tax=Eremothecium gossypii (strain ATCC 10895 / CBS 109.51 / FGSC 9923 / NRRL Y-1056) TaxID=284811 RepID=Q756J9_EREGS|nr:AER255Cp [Eremothecium gossypii ATCC 10895]AAS52936.1 AER255Cp [Eremothecium gossypii ATCC 10895]AEY97244.1 FAER255Cp [Eremothecium gossypii FDAG1]
MALVSGYSSSSGADSDDAVGDLTSGQVATTQPTGQQLGGSIFTAASKRQFEDTSFAILTDSIKKRHYFTKAELKLRRKQRKGTGPWGAWESSNSEGESELAGVITEPVALQGDEQEKDSVAEESSTFYGQASGDYLGRGILHPPADASVDFEKDPLSFQCYLPKRILHVYDGHDRGTTALEFLRKTGHLFLSGGNDGVLKIWDMYHERLLLRDYCGHRKAISATSFSHDNVQFASSSYDKTVKIWDTETGDIINRLSFKATPNCMTFHPQNKEQLLVGFSDSKIRHFDLRVDKKDGVIQIYDHHLAAINALRYFPDGSKFISSSDDKSIRIWENQINIPIKQISDTDQYPAPWIQLHPEHNQFAAQSMDNSIYVYSMKPKYKRHPRKAFRGHKSAGYNSMFDIAPDGRYVAAGDTSGRLFIWDWKTTKILRQLETTKGETLKQVAWSPQETSKIICSGKSGKIFLFD